MPVVMLDPGHGGRRSGAGAGGLREGPLVLDIARKTRRAVKRLLPQARVLLTRDHKTFVSLEQRTAMANVAGADVFVSIHLNASEEPIERGGVSTFVLDRSDDRQALRLAARENRTGVEEVTELQGILARLHRQDQVRASRELARHVQHWTVTGGRRIWPELPSRGVKEAMFYVLVGARMPAVLVEGSFLTHPREAELLKTDRYREALAAGIAEGIVRYLRDAPSAPP